MTKRCQLFHEWHETWPTRHCKRCGRREVQRYDFLSPWWEKE